MQRHLLVLLLVVATSFTWVALGIPASMAQPLSQEQCAPVMQAYGLLMQSKRRCGLDDNSGAMAHAAAACSQVLGAKRSRELQAAGERAFADGERQHGHDQNCAAMQQAMSSAAAPSPADELQQLTDKFMNLYDHGDSAGAVAVAHEVVAKSEALYGKKHALYALALKRLAAAQANAGQLEQALVNQKEGLALDEQLSGPASAEVATSLNNLAEIFFRLNKYDDAQALYERALKLHEKIEGPTSIEYAETQLGLANVLVQQNQFDQADAGYKRALSIMEQHGGGDARIALTLYDMATMLEQKGRYAQALEVLKKVAERQKKSPGEQHPAYGNTLDEIGSNYFSLHQYREAEKFYRQALPIYQKALGPNHIDTVTLLDRIGRAAFFNGVLSPGGSKDGFKSRVADYVAIRREASRALVAYNGSIGDIHTTTGAQREASDWTIFSRHLTALQFAKSIGIGASQQLDRESFEVIQRTARSSVDGAIREMAARFHPEQGQLASLLRDWQDSADAWRATDQQLTKAIEAGDEDQKSALRSKLSELEKRIAELRSNVNRDFPDYLRLIDPAPLTPEQVQRFIGNDEALVVLDSDGEFINSWVVTRTSFSWHTQQPFTKVDAEAIASFRQGLDPDELPFAKPRLFDLALAHDIYERLFSPIEAELKAKKHLIIVPSGALTALPFHLLVTQPPPTAQSDDEPQKNYRDAAWLIKTYAVTVMPSVSDLAALRQTAGSSTAPKPLIGFGDPIFNTATQVADARQRGDQTGKISRGYSKFWTSRGADEAELRTLPRLPETADELRQVAKSLGASPKDLFLGAAATETNVKTMRLSDYRIVYFATHGLVAGDVQGIGEPSLALSVPKEPTEMDDGVLTASEIAQLKLDADWVVLSACNTAAGDKPGADALSGLARAFFYAGARAMLVSHWAVYSKAAVKLTTSIFSEMQKDPSIGRAEALRRSMLALMNDPSDPDNAYPAVWAPFFFVGDGARR